MKAPIPDVIPLRYLWIGVILALLLGGCAPLTPTPMPISAAVAALRTPKPSFTPLPTITPLPTPTPAPPTATAAATAAATATHTPEPSPTATATATPEPTATATATATATSQPPTATATPAPPTPTSEPTHTPQAAAPPPPVLRGNVEPLVLANYFAWFDGDKWGDCNISGGDRPLHPYCSDDGDATARHVHMALGVGIDGFTQQWAAPHERTDRNFRTLLERSQGTGFRSTVIFLRHIWPDGATQAKVVEALRYLRDEYGGHPNFLRVGDKPVIIFTDVYRVTPDARGKSALQFWTEIRREVDPDHRMVWIGEGLDASYLQVFDGLYVYKISHAAYPHDYTKASRWAANVRRAGADKVWMATISPGWDDLRSTCRADIRVANQPHRVERGDGAFYRATYDAALASAPDWLWINSFNEWVEGTYIEPSAHFGDRAMQLTGEFVRHFKGR